MNPLLDTTQPISIRDEGWSSGIHFAANLAKARAKAYRKSLDLIGEPLRGKFAEAAAALELLARDLDVYGREMK